MTAMHRTARATPLFTWACALVMLLAALAPAVSQALGLQGPAAWVEVCSAEGAKWVQAGQDGQAGNTPAPMAAHALEHCPFCSTQAPLLALPPAPLAWLSPGELRHVLHSPGSQQLRPPLAWAHAPARAPPPRI